MQGFFYKFKKRGKVLQGLGMGISLPWEAGFLDYMQECRPYDLSASAC